jgi:membrane-bound lytic murein transglycosylase B
VKYDKKNASESVMKDWGHSRRILLVVWMVAVLSSSLTYSSVSMAVASGSHFEALLKNLKREALDSGIPPKTLDLALSGVELVPRVIELDRRQLGAALTLDDYFGRVISGDRIVNGRKKLMENRILLDIIASRYGVQPGVLVALWGVETDFGRITGSFPVIDSLVTLIYDGRRSSFFRRELIHALRILAEGHITIEEMKGSWAGAMGQLQFMPSTFSRFAVDFDNDGRADIWRNNEDAFASAANYLSQCGWVDDHTWGQEVWLPEEFDRTSIRFKHQKSLSEWKALGVRTMDGQDFPSKDLMSSIIQPDGVTGRAFLVYSNYRVILRWNRSHNFSLSVGILSDLIGEPGVSRSD